MVLYGLLVPLFILFIGASLDLGWYYLNVSRLQNAADAAVVAGAHALVDDINAKNSAAKISVTYNYDGTITDKYSADYLSDADTSVGDKVAANYALKNLSADNAAWTKAQDVKAYTLSDDWSRDGDSEVTLMPFLYESGDETFYYVVYLTEKIEHLFMPGLFGAMDAPVVAVAMLTKNTGTLAAKKVTIVFDANGGTFGDGTDETSREFKAAESMEDDETSEPLYSGKDAPTYSGGKKEFKYYWSTNPNASAEDTSDVFKDGYQMTKNEVAALFGDKDTVTLYAVWEKAKPTNNRTLWEQMQYLIAKNVYDPDWDVSRKKYGQVGQTAKIVHNSFDDINNTYIDSCHYYTERINLETAVTNSSNVGNETRYFIDFRRNDYVWTYLTSPKYYYGENVSNFRVHSLFNVNKAYSVRSGYDDDPLYIRIEAEPGNDYTSSDTANGTYAKNFTPVRQIVLNINADNTADSKRPLFFYYDGPDAVKSHNAEPQPVILNLNADFKGVLFMPDVPVVINGNGHTFQGFIVAKEFRYLDRSRGEKVNYSSDGKTITNASDNLIRVNPSTGDVYSVLADGDDALDIFTNNNGKNKFNLSSNSQFRKFTVETGVKYMYVFYDNTLTMDPTPFYLNTGDLVPLYKLVNGEQVRVINWEDVKLYDSDNMNTRNLISKTITGNENIRTVRLDSNGEPEPLYDEAGNPVYFCEDYVNLTGTYTVFTLDRVADGTRDPKEFLLTKTDELNVANTDDWK
ncbi:MAG: hypothetical protein II902_06140 [Selenomonadaceae bacterium]|nr:hypothetical protein [Selenomonadaceae bacterium]